MLRGGFGALVAGAVFVSSLAYTDPVAAVEIPLTGTLSAALRQSPAPIDGEAVLAALPSGPDGVLTEPPSVPVLPPEPKVADPVVEGFDAELSVEDVSSAMCSRRCSTMWMAPRPLCSHRWPSTSRTSAAGGSKIDPRLVPSGSPGVVEVAAAPWSASFSASGVRVVGEAGTDVVLRPGAGGRLSEPVIGADGLSATYVEAWPGVDLRFVVDNVSVRKELVVRRPGVQSSYEIVFDGLGLTAAPGGGFRLSDTSVRDVAVGGVEVLNRDCAPINEVAKPFEAASPVASSRVDGAPATAVTVGVDAKWLGSLDRSAFPVVIDPVITLGAMTNVRYAFASNGFTCPQNPNCARPRVGNSMASGNTIWRSVFAYDYTSLLPTSTVGSKLVSATMNVAHYSGTTSSQPIALREATWFGWCGFNVANNCANPYTPILDSVKYITTGSTSFNVTSTVNARWTQGNTAIAWGFSGAEPSGVYTFKEINASLSITYDRLPIISASGVSPAANPYQFHDHLNGISLSVPPRTDPDGETLYYRFKICPTNTWTGCGTPKADSGWITSSSWNQWIGVGFPADWYNQQYYWGVQVSNLTSTGYTLNSSWLRPWKLYNSSAAPPQLISPVDGFTWTANNPAQLTFSTPDDPDGDWVSYRAVVRARGTAGVVYRTEWTPQIDPGGANVQQTIVIPADAPLDSNTAYEWTVEFQDSTTYFHWYYYRGQPQGIQPTVRQAAFEARLGSSGPSPMQTLGPVALNLANGNVTTSVATPQVPTSAGRWGCRCRTTPAP